jgi:hypothetical protein
MLKAFGRFLAYEVRTSRRALDRRRLARSADEQNHLRRSLPRKSCGIFHYSSLAAGALRREPTVRLKVVFDSWDHHPFRDSGLIECDTDPKVTAPDDATHQSQPILSHN